MKPGKRPADVGWLTELKLSLLQRQAVTCEPRAEKPTFTDADLETSNRSLRRLILTQFQRSVS